MDTISNDILTRIYASVGKEFGYSKVEAKFVAFRDFKIKWMRSYDWISFEVSDYVDDAPGDIMESLARTIYSKIRGDEDSFYSDEVCEWVMSDDFVDRNQGTYTSRIRGFSKTTCGSSRDLGDSMERLVSMGLIDRDERLRLGWVPRGGSRAGNSSVLMRTVAVNEALDSEDIPEVVLDYCLYAYITHVQLGFVTSRSVRDKEYESILSRFPMRGLAEAEMRRISMKL